MRFLIVLFLAVCLASCASSEAEQLRLENIELKVQLEEIGLQAQQEAANARRAEAEGKLALIQADNAREMAKAAEAAAAKALKDCQGK